MAHKIQIKRGNKADLPVLNDGELGLCQDTNELFIGNDGNQKIFPPTAPTISDVEGLQTALDGKVDNSRVLTDVPANAKFTDTVYTHPATHSADMIVDGTTNKAYTATEKNKLAGIETGANKTTIANNLTETVTGKALDATQGKTLAEQISNLSAEDVGAAPSGYGLGVPLSTVSIVDSNQTTITGMYYGLPSDPNKPAGVNDGALLVMAHSTPWVNQVYFDWRTQRIYVRIRNNGTWSAWSEIYSTTNVTISTSAPSSALAEGAQHQVY